MERCRTVTDWRVPYLEKQMVVYAREASVLSFSVTTRFVLFVSPFFEGGEQLWDVKP